MVCIATHLFTYIICSINVIFSEGEDGTPLACAAGRGHVKIVNYLLGHDVDINGGITVTSVASQPMVTFTVHLHFRQHHCL